MLRAVALALLLAACSGDPVGDIRAHVAILADGENPQALEAARYLTRYGRQALPTLEGAMHLAKPPGRKNLILAMRKIGDPEAVPLLRHIAIYDPSPDVRREARWTLEQWAMGEGARAEKARAALRAVDEATGAERAG